MNPTALKKIYGYKHGENRSVRGVAFTLVELMIVVAVIGVVAGIVLAAAGGVQKGGPGSGQGGNQNDLRSS